MNKTTASENYLIALYPNRGITFTKGNGVYLYDQNGEKYLDLGSNYGVNIFGYNHPSITSALQRQLNDLVNLHCSFNNQVRTQAAENLLKATNGRLSKVFFSNSGAEAIEAALKFTRVATGKSHFIAMKNAYHGKTLGLYPQQVETGIEIHSCLFSGILLILLLGTPKNYNAASPIIPQQL